MLSTTVNILSNPRNKTGGTKTTARYGTVDGSRRNRDNRAIRHEQDYGFFVACTCFACCSPGGFMFYGKIIRIQRESMSSKPVTLALHRKSGRTSTWGRMISPRELTRATPINREDNTIYLFLVSVALRPYGIVNNN